MPSYSLAGGVDASYAIAAGRTVVTIQSMARMKHRAVYCGTGQMIFHWVQEGKTQAWKCDVSMSDPAAAQVDESAGEDGSQRLTVDMGEVYPAGCLLQGRMVGALVAPAVHVDVPLGSDIWVFLIRSPWFPLKLQLDRPGLSVAHGGSQVAASLAVADGGSLGVQTAVTGTDFKSASLVMKRTVGPNSSEEPVCEVGAGAQAAEWKPILRSFDLLLITKGSISESQLADLAKGLGAQVSSGIFGAGSMEGDFVLCDGPATSYTLTLKGHRGFLENVEDCAGARLSW